jgi:hypothetical protein
MWQCHWSTSSWTAPKPSKGAPTHPHTASFATISAQRTLSLPEGLFDLLTTQADLVWIPVVVSGGKEQRC